MAQTQSSTPDPITVSIEVAGRMLGISRSTIWRLCRAGDLTEVHIGGRCLISIASLNELVARGSKTRPSAA